MSDQLTNTFSMDTDLAVIEGRKHQYLHSAEAEEAIKRGALHTLAMQIHAEKGKKGMGCIKQVNREAMGCTIEFGAEAFKVVELGLRSSQDEQAWVQANVGPLLSLHSEAIRALAYLVDRNITDVAITPIPVNPTRKWWQI